MVYTGVCRIEEDAVLICDVKRDGKPAGPVYHLNKIDEQYITNVETPVSVDEICSALEQIK